MCRTVGAILIYINYSTVLLSYGKTGRRRFWDWKKSFWSESSFISLPDPMFHPVCVITLGRNCAHPSCAPLRVSLILILLVLAVFVVSLDVVPNPLPGSSCGPSWFHCCNHISVGPSFNSPSPWLLLFLSTLCVHHSCFFRCRWLSWASVILPKDPAGELVIVVLEFPESIFPCTLLLPIMGFSGQVKNNAASVGSCRHPYILY